MNTPAMLFGGLAVLMITVGVSHLLSARLGRMEERIAAVVPRPLEATGSLHPRSRRDASPHRGLLARFRESQRIALQGAGVDLSATTWLAVRVVLVLLSLIVLFLSPLLGLLVLILAALGPSMWLRRRKEALRTRIGRDLPDALLALANALRSGLSVTQALSTLASDYPPPLGDLFRETLQAVGLGSTIDTSFETFADRTGIAEFHVLATAMSIQRQSGGNLSDILESVATVISEKLKLRERVKALTAEPRLSAWVLSILPVGVGLMIFFLNPGFITPLVTTLAGHLMLGFAALWEAIGVFFIRSVARID